MKKSLVLLITGTLALSIAVPTSFVFAKSNADTETNVQGVHRRFQVEHSIPKLDDATKEKLEAIYQQVKDGTLTREQAKDEITKLGIDFHRGHRNHKFNK